MHQDQLSIVKTVRSADMAELMEMFTCPHHAGNLQLSKNSCASMWNRARAARHDSCNPVEVCCGCEIGAKHAGHEMESDERRQGLVDYICARCHRPATRFVYGCLCVSCYNRGREVLLGKNARGAPPKKLRPLIDVVVAYVDEGVTRRVTVSRVVDETEARLTLVRKNCRVMEFVHTSKALIRQADLFGAMLFMGGSTRKRARHVGGRETQTELGQLAFFGDVVNG